MDKEFCGYCGLILGEQYFKCRICGQLNCLECRNSEHKCCVKCAEGLGEAEPSKSVKGESSSSTKIKKTPNPAFTRPMTLSPELVAVVGEMAMPRTEVTKKLWDYIKKNGLQDPVNRRMINADDRLRAVFGGNSKVSMFEMTKLVSKHMK